VEETADIGLFLITSEGSVGAGIRRIEAVTGRKAYEMVRKRFKALNKVAARLETSPEQAPAHVEALQDELGQAHRQVADLRRQLAEIEFLNSLDVVSKVGGVPVLATTLPGADANTLRQMADRFRQRYPSGVAVLASVSNGSPILIAAITEDLVAGDLVKSVAQPLGGGGGGRPTLAQAGGKDASKLEEALNSVARWVEERLAQAREV
jgi:alanyl-tRNA synthetase